MHLLSIIVFITAFSYICCMNRYREYCNPIFGKWQSKDLHRQCCEVPHSQMKLIAWYFQRVYNYIQVTEVVPEALSSRRSRFASYFLKDLHKHTGLEYLTFRVDYSYRDQLIDEDEPYAQTYQWHAELSKGLNRTHLVEDTESTVQRIPAKGGERDDSPEYGSVVLAEDIETLDFYLNGKTRHPFKAKRAHYVLMVYRTMDPNIWDKWASSVMSKLWRHHGILNAIIISTCKQNNFGFYDPFVNVKELNVDNVDEWGIFRCVPLQLLNANGTWLLQKGHQLNQFPLTFTIFNRFPTMIKKEDLPPFFADSYINNGMKTSGFGGIDGILLGILAEEINFDLHIIEPPWDETYGYRLNNGTFTGTISDVLYGRADAAFNGRFLLEYGSPEIEFMLPILGDKVCIIAPAAEKIPQWKAIFKCFDISFWYSFLLITLILSICFCLLKFWQEKQEMMALRKTVLYTDFKRYVVEEKSNVSEVFYTTWKVMMGITAIMPNGSMERLLIGACLLANLIISGTFESYLYTAYTKRSFYKNIDTLHDLDESNLQISASSPSLRNLFGNSQTSSSDVLKSLKKKYILDDGVESAIERTAIKRDICSVERYSDVNIIIQTKFLHRDGSPKLHVIKECPRHYFLTYIIRKGWPLLPRFNQVIDRLAEAGLVRLWYESTEAAFITSKNIANMKFNNELHVPRKPFSLTDIQTSFYFLIIGHLIASVIFLIEKFILTPDRLAKISKSNFRKNIRMPNMLP